MGGKFCYGCMSYKTQEPICEHCGFDERQLNLVHQLPIGTVLKNQYVIGRVLGQGGFGITYMGWDRILKTRVAIKEYFPSGIIHRNVRNGLSVYFYDGNNEAAFVKHRERFLKEAQTLAQLSSIPEIVQVKNFFAENNTAYIVMEYVEGITLKDHLKRLGRPMTVPEALDIMEPVLKALGKVHGENLIHRDISPDNIMLPVASVKLIDFGTVRYLDESNRSKSTESVLKPGFAPMEQYNARGNVGTWTDVHAICATFHYLLTGKVPADATTRLEEGDYLPELHKMDGISPEVAQVLEKGMALRVSDRIQTVEQLRTMLYEGKPLAKSPAVPASETKAELSNKPSRKKKKWIVLAAAAMLAAAGMIYALMSTAPKEQPVISTSPAAEPSEYAAVTEPAVPTVPETHMPVIPEKNVLMENTFATFNWDIREAEVFGNKSLKRGEILSITFMDSLSNVPDNAWDVSLNQDGKVMAWVDEERNLFIAANGMIYAPEDSTGLFSGYFQVKEFSFNGCFSTEGVTDMSEMFHFCTCTEKLDLSFFDTSYVTDMSNMFANSVWIMELDLSGFDTSQVVNMEGMFSELSSLKELDISHFDTSKVESMTTMFWGCRALKNLKIGEFDTSSVVSNHNFAPNEHICIEGQWIPWRTLFQ